MLREENLLERIVETNGHSKALCISTSHNEREPSMHVYGDHVYCFGCRFHADVVDVLGVLRDIERPTESAYDLARGFNIRLPKMSRRLVRTQSRSARSTPTI